MNLKFWQRKAVNRKRAALFVSKADQQRLDVERLLALAEAGNSALFKAVLAYADEHARNEHEACLRPDLVNDVRQFNCGRSASAYDFAGALRDIQAKAAKQADQVRSAG